MAPTERYGYSVARLRAMEVRLLDDNILQRMLESQDMEGALKVLGETSYSNWLVELKANDEFDQAIEAELKYVYNELAKFIPDSDLVSLCRMPYDFHNVKVLLKSGILQRQGGERRFDLLTSLGNIETDDLIMAIESEDYRLLPFGLHAAVPQALAMYEQSHELLEVEKFLDDLMFRSMAEIVEKLNISGVRDWFKARVDAENVRTLLRLSRMGLETSVVSTFLHSGGWISRERVLTLLTEPVESWGRDLSFANIGRVFEKLQDIADTGTLLVEFEKVLDDYVTSNLQKSGYEAFDPLNVLYYLWSKEMEAKNIRIILVSIANNADPEIVRRLLRNVR